MAHRAIYVTARRTARQFAHDRRGAILALVAVAITALIGFAGLGVETGLWYALKRQQQIAADYAAFSGAMEIAVPTYAAADRYFRSSDNSGICGLAKRAAGDPGYNRFTFAAGFACPNATPGQTDPGDGQMYANNPPVLGAHAGQANYVEVILGQQQNTFFANLFLPSVMIRSRAVAGVEIVGQACSMALAPGGIGINMAGNTTVNMGNCGFASNSTASNSINFQGSATVNTAWFQAAGGSNTNGGPTINVPAILTYAPPVTDPYSCDPDPDNPITSGCAGTITWPALPFPAVQPFPAGGGVLQPGTYPKIGNSAPFNFAGANTWTLCPGVYVLDRASNGQFDAMSVSSNATVQMGTAGAGGCPANGIDGVTIIATSSTLPLPSTDGGGFTIASGATVQLSAPGPASKDALLAMGLPTGLLFVQDPAHAHLKNGPESTITANGTTALQGVIYTPGSDVQFTGNSNSTCFHVIAATITFTGNSTRPKFPAAAKTIP